MLAVVAGLALSGPAARAGGLVTPVDAPQRANAALAGKHVYLSQAHGWFWDGAWLSQRPNSHGIIEDFVNAEAVDQFLVQYLENAGATVWPIREADLNPALVVVDDGDGAAHPDNGLYQETGGGFATSTASGFVNFTAPYGDGVNPFEQGESRYHYVSAEGGPAFRWTPNLPADGTYQVHISWAASANRAPDAHFVVHHAGGDSHFRVDQRRHGHTWVRLGAFRFVSGSHPESGSVELLTDSAQAGEAVVSADAVRFGGGVGLIRRGDGSGLTDSPTSGRPRWEECARYACQYNGAPPDVYDYRDADNSDDVVSRSRYAAWQHLGDEDAVFLSWHTNAPDPGRGTSTYVYGPNEPDGSYVFTGAPGSDLLAELVHNEIVHDLQLGWDAQWQDRGLYSAWFGELNPDHNDEMPSVLVEVAFHDTEADCLQLQEPRFRQVVARAMYQGVARFFSEKDGTPLALTPEPPVAFRAFARAGGGAVRLEWQPPSEDTLGLAGDAPQGYRVYRSRDGRAFDNGEEVGAVTQVELEGPATGETAFFRVTAWNAGGESMPTPVLAVRPGEEGQAPALIVGAFERLDRASLVPIDRSAWGLGVDHHMDLARMNRFDYVVEHAHALEAVGLPFDSAWHDAPLTPDDLTRFRLVDWACGEESTVDEALSVAELELLGAFRAAGGNLLVTGAEVGWDLVEQGTPEEQAAFAGLFHAQYLGDDAESYLVRLAGGSELTLDDSTLGTYDVDYPDLIGPLEGAQAIALYDSDPATPAASLYRDPCGGAVALTGFPLEAAWPLEARVAFLAAVLEGFAAPAQGVCAGAEAADETAAETTAETVTETEIGTETVTDTVTGTDAVAEVGPDWWSDDLLVPEPVEPGAGGCAWSRGAAGGQAGLLSILLVLGMVADRKKRGA
jgi:hypothetical protein